jgi:long-chain fatty acid transport protein
MLRFLRMRLRHCPRRAPLVVVFLLAASGAASRVSAQARNDDDELAQPNVRVSIAQGSGARALGMGGAFLARPDDGTAASWNPAGLSYLQRLEVSAAGYLTSAQSIGIDDNNELANDDRLDATTIDFLSAAFPFEAEHVTGAAQLSYQRAIPFGGKRRIGRSRSRHVEVDTKGGFDVIAAGLGLRLSRSFRFGATVNRWVNGYEANFSVRHATDPTSMNAEVHERDLTLNGWNMHAGAIWSPLPDDKLNFGIVGKTPFDAKVSHYRRRRDFSPDVEPPNKEEFRSDLQLRFPGTVGIGTSWRIAMPLTASVDYTYSFWSDAAISGYFQLDAREVQNYGRLPFPDISTATTQEDTEQIRMGLEYVFFFGKVKCPLRVGYFSDKQYFRTDIREIQGADDGPAPRFNAFTAGTGIAAGNVLVDMAYVQERGRYYDGTSKTTTTHRVYMSVIFRYAGR